MSSKEKKTTYIENLYHKKNLFSKVITQENVSQVASKYKSEMDSLLGDSAVYKQEQQMKDFWNSIKKEIDEKENELVILKNRKNSLINQIGNLQVDYSTAVYNEAVWEASQKNNSNK